MADNADAQARLHQYQSTIQAAKQEIVVLSQALAEKRGREMEERAAEVGVVGEEREEGEEEDLVLGEDAASFAASTSRRRNRRHKAPTRPPPPPPPPPLPPPPPSPPQRFCHKIRKHVR